MCILIIIFKSIFFVLFFNVKNDSCETFYVAQTGYVEEFSSIEGQCDQKILYLNVINILKIC